VTGWTADAAAPRIAYGGKPIDGEVAFTMETLAGKSSTYGGVAHGPTNDCAYRNRAAA
jgi:hypothetical protein